MSKGNARRSPWRLLGAGFAITLAAFVVGVGVCEALGWPFLAAPMQRWLGTALARRVSLSEDPAATPKVVIHLLGGIELSAPYIQIGAPAWSQAPAMLLAHGARLTLGYADLWRAHRGEPLRIRELRAAQLDGYFERLADGRASWQFGKKTDVPDTAEQPTRMPVFGRLQVDAGTMVLRDALMAVDLDAKFSLVDGANLSAAGASPGVATSSLPVGASAPLAAASGAAPTATATATATATPAERAPGLQLIAKGSYRKLPLSIDVQTSGVLPVIADDAATVALPVTVDAHIGRARITFKGTATDALRLTALQGRFMVEGPSLAAVGDPVGVTLPTTGPFRTEGQVVKQGAVWNAVLDRMSIGSSRLGGAFTYDPRPRLPLLSGRLTGSRLALADLGPALGGAVRSKGSDPVAAIVAPAAPKRVNATPGRMLPDREFDLPSLRAMNANVLVGIDTVDLGSGLLEPLKPLRTHLVLADGVLTLRDIDARTGQGRLGGTVQLDGRNALALWTANVRWDGVRLESWIHQARADKAPPWATGRLSGQARVAGQGKSTAAILGTLRGGVRMNLANGTVSHLAVEAAGLDIAQGLGMLVKGDDALSIQCTVADFVAEQGVLRPRALVLDTADSTLWVDGTLSLASEAIDLRVVVAPKDFSPLALRTPIHLRGSFANPSVSIEKGKLGARVGAAALLALVNPLAALLPLLDFGDGDDAKRGAADCRALSRRIAAAPALPAPAPASAPSRAGNPKAKSAT
jgi:AsmA family protein